MQLISTIAPHGGFSTVSAVFKNGIIIDIIIAVLYIIVIIIIKYTIMYLNMYIVLSVRAFSLKFVLKIR